MASLKVGTEPAPERGIQETQAPKESKTGMWSKGWLEPGEVVARGETGKGGRGASEAVVSDCCSHRKGAEGLGIADCDSESSAV